jgi:hypothetical protein
LARQVERLNDAERQTISRALQNPVGQQPPVGLQPRQDDQEEESVDKQADRKCIRTDPDGPLFEALTGCNQE